jgi:hypothetical protein
MVESKRAITLNFPAAGCFERNGDFSPTTGRGTGNYHCLRDWSPSDTSDTDSSLKTTARFTKPLSESATKRPVIVEKIGIFDSLRS